MRDGDLMTHFNKIAEEMRRIKPFNIYYYLVLRKLTYIKWSNAHYKLLKLTKNILIIELNMNISVNDT